MYDFYCTNFELELKMQKPHVLERNKEWIKYLKENRPEIISNFVPGRMSF